MTRIWCRRLVWCRCCGWPSQPASTTCSALSVPSPNAVAKARRVVGGMLAGADSIDDLDLLRHGGMGRLFGGVRAPSTLGTFLRSFTHGHVQQLDRSAGGCWPGSPRGFRACSPALTTQGDRVRRCRRHHPGGPRLRQAGRRVRVLRRARAQRPARHDQHPDRGAGDRPGPAAPGNAASATGAAVCWPRPSAPPAPPGSPDRSWPERTRPTTATPSSGTALRHGAWFTVTARMNPPIKPRSPASTRTRGPRSRTRTRSSTKPRAAGSAMPRSPRSRSPRSPAAARPSTWPAGWSCAGSSGSSPGIRWHRAGRAVRRLPPPRLHHQQHPDACSRPTSTTATTRSVEQVIAELKNGPLAHLPSGRYAANAAWVALRGHRVQPRPRRRDRRRPAQRTLGDPAHPDHQHPRPGSPPPADAWSCTCPTHWPWAAGWESLWHAATGPPRAVAT